MHGSILGDMCGAPYEFCLIKTTDFNFQPSFFTDDTVLTVAVAHALMSCGEENNPEKIKESLIQSMQYFGRKYDNVGYSPAFYSWLLKRKTDIYIMVYIITNHIIIFIFINIFYSNIKF